MIDVQINDNNKLLAFFINLIHFSSWKIIIYYYCYEDCNNAERRCWMEYFSKVTYNVVACWHSIESIMAIFVDCIEFQWKMPSASSNKLINKEKALDYFVLNYGGRVTHRTNSIFFIFFLKANESEQNRLMIVDRWRFYLDYWFSLNEFKIDKRLLNDVRK